MKLNIAMWLRLPRRSARAAALCATVIAGALVASPVQPAMTASLPSLRLVDPVLTSENSYDFTFDAINNAWISSFTPGLKVKFFYRNVGTTFSLTFEAKDSAGQLWPNKPVYLIVNKMWSCSEATFTSPVETLFDPPGHHDSYVIQRDWCGDKGNGTSPQAGETAVPGVTDAQGRVTFTLTNTNLPSVAEPAPLALNVTNSYTGKCYEDKGCLLSVMTASFTQRPGVPAPGASDPADKLEDKDLLWVHFVNNSVTAESPAVTKELADKSVTMRFRVADLTKSGKSGVSVTFTQSSGPDASYITDTGNGANPDGTVSATTDAEGWASVVLHADPTVAGNQVVSAKIDGTPSTTRSTVTWVAKIQPPAVKPAVTKAPAVSGSAKVGKQLKATSGTWAGSPVFSYAWAACSKSGKSVASLPKDCSLIKGATKATLTLAKGHAGKYIRVRVAAKNSAGTVYSVSATTAKVG